MFKGVAHFQNQNYLVTESLNEKYGHKNPNNSHNYHDENHDEMEFFQGNNKRGT